MKAKWYCVFFIGMAQIVVAKVHKFSPEFQAIYDAASAPEVQAAQRHGAKAKIICQVVDDSGMPVVNTAVRGTWQNDYPRKVWKETFVTDTNGMFVAEGTVGGGFGCYIEKAGYYSSSIGVKFYWRSGVSPLVKDGKWQPYGEYKTIVLKRIKNPANMNLVQHVWFEAPATNVWLGFDLEHFAWTSPYGCGKNDDLLVRFNYQEHNKYYTDWSTMDISFTNNIHAGFYKLKKDAYSELKTPYAVDSDRIFLTTNTYRTIGTKCQILEKDSCIVFRTRTKVDAEGRLASAYYGMIYGPWTIDTGMRAEAIFFNPRANDTNLEDVGEFTRTLLRNRGVELGVKR